MFKVTTRCQWCGTHMPALHVCFFINHTTKYYAPTYAMRTTAENCVKSANVSAVFAPDWLQPPAYQLLCWQSGLTCSSCVAKRKRIFSTPMYCMYHVVGVLHCRGPDNPSELRSPSRYQGGSTMLLTRLPSVRCGLIRGPQAWFIGSSVHGEHHWDTLPINCCLTLVRNSEYGSQKTLSCAVGKLRRSVCALRLTAAQQRLSKIPLRYGPKSGRP